jgi:hypothetical protein
MGAMIIGLLDADIMRRRKRTKPPIDCDIRMPLRHVAQRQKARCFALVIVRTTLVADNGRRRRRTA